MVREVFEETVSDCSWIDQDVLQLSTGEWKTLLMDPKIFSCEALRMILFVYNQAKHQSTVSAIASALSTGSRTVHNNRIYAWNRGVAKNLYQKYAVEPPFAEGGGRRYWNVIFEGSPEEPLDRNKHFYWRLRPNLVRALREMV